MSTGPALRPASPDVAAPPETVAAPSSHRPDLRAVGLGLAAWAGGLGGFLLPAPATLALAAGVLLVLGVRRHRGRSILLGSAWMLAAAAVAGSATLRADAIARSPMAGLAEEGAFVSALLDVGSDPLLREGRFGAYVLVRGTAREVTGRGATHRSVVPVLVIGDESWSDVALGSVVRVSGRAAPAEGPDLAAVLATSRPPELVREPGDLLDGAATVRAAIRRAVSGVGEEQRALVPALVVGDDRGMPEQLVTEFRTTGLTHLLAVSGTNLTLVVGFVLVLARWAGVRARGLVLVGVLGVVGFVLLARTEPSVLRAAAMGSVALLGLGSGGRERGVRALGVAVLVLLLIDPWLVLSVGFALSTLATAGILLLAPPWRDALTRWLPRWLAEAVAVPLAAQLACTPVVAAISDQVSLVAVAANMVAAPAVGPATVLGLLGGLVLLVSEPVGRAVGAGAGGCAWWITEVAEQAARLPTAATAWPASAGSIALLSVLCLGLAAVLPAVLARRGWSLCCGLVCGVVVVVPLPAPGWPPDGWVMVACDVGQGDGLVLNAGGAAAVVVDVGPEPALIDRCLDRLGTRRLHVVLLTHFHADHVDGLEGALGGRSVGAVEVTGFADPWQGAAAVESTAAAAGLPVRVPTYGELRSAGSLTWQVVGPAGSGPAPAGEQGSAANNASVALVVEVRGVRILLTGDVEPEAQQEMARALPALRVDVLKVPHHGSRYQDAGFLTGLGARLALISVGEGNDYGHPAPETLELLEHAGMLVRRTDRDGDVAVVVQDGALRVVTSR